MAEILARTNGQFLVEVALKNVTKQTLTLVYSFLVPLDSFSGLNIRDGSQHLNEAFGVIYAFIFSEKIELFHEEAL